MTHDLTRPLPPAVGEGQQPQSSVWTTGQDDLGTQLTAGGYHPDTAGDTNGMPPAVAAHAIATYTRPDQLVLDPNCGAGTVLVEALRAGRHAAGATDDPRRWALTHTNITTTADSDGSPRQVVLEPVQPRILAGTVDLILTSLRPGQRLRRRRPATGSGSDPAAGLRTLLDWCQPLLRPGGHLVVAARRRRQHGVLVNIPGAVLAAGQDAGLIPVDRCIALLAGLRGQRVLTRASLAQRRTAAHHQRTTGHLISLPAHLDVLVFRAPHTSHTPPRPQPCGVPTSLYATHAPLATHQATPREAAVPRRPA